MWLSKQKSLYGGFRKKKSIIFVFFHTIDHLLDDLNGKS